MFLRVSRQILYVKNSVLVFTCLALLPGLRTTSLTLRLNSAISRARSTPPLPCLSVCLLPLEDSPHQRLNKGITSIIPFKALIISIFLVRKHTLHLLRLSWLCVGEGSVSIPFFHVKSTWKMRRQKREES